MKKEEQLARGILKHIGGKENIRSFTNCMTRVRIDVVDQDKVDKAALKAIDGVMGVIEDEVIQIVVGPGTVNKVSAHIANITGISVGEASGIIGEEVVRETKEGIKQRNNTPVKNMLRKIGSIFIPLIPGIVGSGIINGGRGFLEN